MNKFYSPSNQAKIMQQIARQEMSRTVETKHANYTSTDGVEIFHNNFVTLDNAVLKTTPGPFDPTLNNADCRIGDEINLRGVKIKMMVELNERFTDVTHRLLIVKCAKGDNPTRDTLFNGLSGNKMIDTINTERYTILASKVFKIKAGNSGTYGGAHVLVPADGLNKQAVSEITIQRQTKIVSLWIPGTKFKKNRRIQYEQGSSQPKFFDYHVVLYAYSNYTTVQDVYYVSRVNDYVKTMYYKDA